MHQITSLRRLTALLAFLLVLAGSGPALAATSTVSGMEIELEFDRTEIVVGEPVYLKLRVTNRNAPVRIGNFSAKLFLSEGNDINVTIQRPGELPYRYQGTEAAAVYTSTEIHLDNTESIHQEFTLLYDSKRPTGFLFDEPGEYIMGATLTYSILRNPEKNATAIPPMRIHVKQPEGEAAEAFKLINTVETARALHANLTPDQKTLDRVRQVADKYPNTPYGPGCTFLVGAGQMNLPTKHEAAVAAFRKFLQQYPQHIRTSAALFNIALTYQQAGIIDRGRDWFFYLKDHDPSYYLLRPENPMSHNYYFGTIGPASARRWWMYSQPWDVKPEKKQQRQQ